MNTNLITADGYAVYQLLRPIDIESAANHPEIAYLGGTFNPPAAGHLMDAAARLPHYPWHRVHTTVEAALADQDNRGGCRAVRAVRPQFGGGFIEAGPDWLVEGPALAWAHDSRFHLGCPEEERGSA